MKKTEYFKKKCNYNNADDMINKLITDRDDFLTKNKAVIAKIDSEDLRVDALGNNQSICILRLTYYPK